MNTNEPIEIIAFSEDFKDAIKTLNYEWLQQYFSIEQGDERSLSHPKEEIIDRGGFIFYAKQGRTILGTASLLKKSATVFELGKMAVGTPARGKGIGKLLLVHCLDFAKSKHIEKLILYSNTKLESAIHLYRSYGFQEIELEPGVYQRANIKMEKWL